MQYTISKPASCCGIGVHSGRAVNLIMRPAITPNSGIVFVRTDITGENNFIKLSHENVYETELSTSLRSNNITVHTVEHLVAAIWGCGIDNLIVEIDGPEIPIMDGSSKAFVLAIEFAGKKMQNHKRKYLEILKDFKVCDGDSEIIARPSNSLEIDLTIDFPVKVIGKQNMKFSKKQSFLKNIAAARTFGFVNDLEYLQSIGKAKGASLENAVGIDKKSDSILNKEGLRFHNEFVRHKLLDLLGDLYSCGSEIQGKLTGYKTGHRLNNIFLRKLLEDQNNYRFISSDQGKEPLA